MGICRVYPYVCGPEQRYGYILDTGSECVSKAVSVSICSPFVPAVDIQAEKAKEVYFAISEQ